MVKEKTIKLSGFVNNVPDNADWYDKHIEIEFPLSMAKQLRSATKDKIMETVISSYIEQSKQDMKLNLEALNEQVAEYNVYMNNARLAFKKAKEEQLDASEKLWTKFEDIIPNIVEKVREVENVLKPVEEKLDKLSKKLVNIEDYKMERLLNTIQKFNSLWEEDKEVFKFLMNNYKKEDDTSRG